MRKLFISLIVFVLALAAIALDVAGYLAPALFVAVVMICVMYVALVLEWSNLDG